MRNLASDLRIPRSDALPLSHRDSTVSEVYYEVHMTRVLHTARISNVDSVMFVDRNKRDDCALYFPRKYVNSRPTSGYAQFDEVYHMLLDGIKSFK
ncbi:hypothetical protein pdam_00019742 [Pocillopora damicornis]|uniref:Uncharacterized protein n=1 Tax=Pocillopora damicornis TaxID=46731 RepID=A0A3M6TW20_POCDA|nr:hypothetical protein pdam_00019742 [Pocillopora damicornis]